MDIEEQNEEDNQEGNKDVIYSYDDALTAVGKQRKNICSRNKIEIRDNFLGDCKSVQ